MNRFLSLLFSGSLLFLLGCNTPKGAPTFQAQLYPIDQDTRVAETVGREEARAAADLIAPYKDQLDTKMNRVLVEVATPMVKDRPESNLGNWVADLLESAARDVFPDHDIAFAVQNHGGIRIQGINTGPLRVSKLYELMPFDNELVAMELPGKVVKEFVNHIVNDGGWPVSQSLRVSRQDGRLSVKVNGEEIQPDRQYVIALPDYVASGGGDSEMLRGKRQIKSGRLVRDLLIEYAGKITGPLSVTSAGDRMVIDR